MSPVRSARTKAAKWGFAVALLLAALELIAALWNPMTSAPEALLFFLVATGIWRGWVWSAYGGALFTMALLVGILASTVGLSAIPWGSVVAATLLLGPAALVLYRAGRSTRSASLAAGAPWIALALGYVGFLLGFRAFIVPTAAMENTILNGDYILVRQFALPKPARGQVVAFRSPSDASQILVKRVVALGGDRLQLKDRQVHLNGVAQSEPYLVRSTSFTEMFRDNFPQEPSVPLAKAGWAETLKSNRFGAELLIPEGQVFVLGDNRDVSLDSRYFGFMAEKDIVGHPKLVYFSVDRPLEPAMRPPLLEPKTIRWSRVLNALE